MPDNNAPCVLFTNLFILSRTGSELHVFELSKAFIKKGWNVSVYTLVAGYPMQGLFNELGVELIQFGEESKLRSNYDLLYAQHHLISEYLYYHLNVSFDRVVVSILGLGNMEALPDFYMDANVIAFVSEEARDHNKDDLERIEKNKVIVFPNYANESFFCVKREILKPSSLKKIAVISNHIPDELRGIEELFRGNGVIVEYYGSEDASVEVSPHLLIQYDLVISIGRTVQDCFACGVPIYCYDHFGGPGFIDPLEIDVHAYCNFSGRSYSIKKTSQELYEDILEGYSSAVINLNVLRNLAMERWNFEKIFDELYSSIDSNGTDVSKPARKRYISDAFTSRQVCALYQQEVLKKTGIAQVFWKKQNTDLMKKEPSIIRYSYNAWISAKGSFAVPEGFVLARFIPDDCPCEVRVQYNTDPCSVEYRYAEFMLLTSSPEIDISSNDIDYAKLDFSFCVDHIDRHKAFALYDEAIASINAELENRTIGFIEKSLSIRYLIGRLPKAIKHRLLRNWNSHR